MEEPGITVPEISPIRPKWLAVGAMVVLFGLVLRDAWVTEDAYITLRTVDNLVHGFGLRWNIDERVQGYTHPLWMALLSAAYAVTREDYFTTVFVGVATSFAAMLALLKLSRSGTHALIAVVLLTLSRSFVQFSTSGLENPLTHLLVAIFVLLYVVRETELRWLALCAALIALNRSDAVLVAVPALLHACWLSYRAHGLKLAARELLLGVSPYLAWELFSLFYYGFLFPNTAYAKLNTGLPSREIVRQGFTYILNGLAWDPAVLIVTGLGTTFAFMQKRLREALLAVGALLYIVYVVRIGGDFMHGRFLTLPLFLSVCLIATARVLPLEQPAAALALLAPFAFLYLHPSATEKYPIESYAHSGIADERMFYRDGLSMMMSTRTHKLPNHHLARDGLAARASPDKVQIYGNIGLYGFYAGPFVHIIDPIALTEPLLARLPIRYDANWRVGHYIRVIPAGYAETLLGTGACLMADRGLCEYRAKLLEIVSGPLWSWSRIKTIVAMNFRVYDYLIDFELYRYPDLVRADLASVSTRVGEGSAWNGPGTRTFTGDGIALTQPKSSHASKLLLSLDANDSYDIEFRQGNKLLETSSSTPAGPGTMKTRIVQIGRSTKEAGFDRIDIRPTGGDGMYSVGFVRLVE
ncbi:MAG: hypothetical protein JWN04_3371 [Myxococcaceae bacterium]|nr:hypothetical protein [Myxococcaceae bacterium]